MIWFCTVEKHLCNFFQLWKLLGIKHNKRGNRVNVDCVQKPATMKATLPSRPTCRQITTGAMIQQTQLIADKILHVSSMTFVDAEKKHR